MSNENYYYSNEKYSAFLDNQKIEDFKKVVDTISKYTKESDYILDLGCGAGNLLESINDRKNKLGIEISNTSIEKSKIKNLNCVAYDGKKLPFENNKFNLAVSYNVLEHVDNINLFLSEALRVLKSDGYLIIACPNFLSVTNNFHWHTTGFKQKFKNILDIFINIFTKNYNFDKMKTVDREDFHPDDDACNVTNPIDIYKWSKKNNLKIEYWSSQSVYKNSRFINFIDKTIFKIFFGSCFFIFKK